MKRECRQINYNWRQVGPLQADEGFEFDSHVVGLHGVVSIANITPTENYCGPEFYDVNFDDGRVVTVYNINEAFLFPVKTPRPEHDDIEKYGYSLSYSLSLDR